MFQSFSNTIVRVISDVFKFGESDHMDCAPTAPLPRSSLWLWWIPYRSFEGESPFQKFEPFLVFKHEKDYHNKPVSLKKINELFCFFNVWSDQIDLMVKS